MIQQQPDGSGPRLLRSLGEVLRKTSLLRRLQAQTHTGLVVNITEPSGEEHGRVGASKLV